MQKNNLHSVASYHPTDVSLVVCRGKTPSVKPPGGRSLNLFSFFLSFSPSFFPSRFLIFSSSFAFFLSVSLSLCLAPPFRFLVWLGLFSFFVRPLVSYLGRYDHHSRFTPGSPTYLDCLLFDWFPLVFALPCSHSPTLSSASLHGVFGS
jgi:hypothetical protein